MDSGPPKVHPLMVAIQIEIDTPILDNNIMVSPNHGLTTNSAEIKSHDNGLSTVFPRILKCPPLTEILKIIASLE